MSSVCQILALNPLFRGIDNDLYAKYCKNPELVFFSKGDFIVHEGDEFSAIGVLIDGQALMQRYSGSGECTTLNMLNSTDTFADSLVFSSSSRLDFSLLALSNCEVLFIKREDVLSMIAQSPELLMNYLRNLSDTVCAQKRRVYLLSQRTLRQKISCYLLELLREQLMAEGQTLETTSRIISTQAVELPSSKEVAARLLAMPRPSFSRELIAMEADGLIRVSGRVIWLIDLLALEKGLSKSQLEEHSAAYTR